MPVYSISNELVFPHPDYADESGLLAVGGDLSIDRLLLAYSYGIFPWYSGNEPIMWWSPDPRMVLYPDKFKVSKSLKQSLNTKNYKVRFDTNFSEVVGQCALVPRNGETGTWITDEMCEAYEALHKAGYAHSVEVFEQNNLIGGLYGVSLGRAFFGESMFFKKRDASKIALYHLVEKLKSWNFEFIDAQIETEHLKRMGATNIPRKKFLMQLEEALRHETKKGKW